MCHCDILHVPNNKIQLHYFFLELWIFSAKLWENRSSIFNPMFTILDSLHSFLWMQICNWYYFIQTEKLPAAHLVLHTWLSSLNFHLSEKVFISPAYLKDIFTDHGLLIETCYYCCVRGIKDISFLSFYTSYFWWEVYFHILLLNVRCPLTCFFWLFLTFSLYPWFSVVCYNVFIWSLKTFFSWVYQACWIYKFILFSKLRKLLALILNIFLHIFICLILSSFLYLQLHIY